MQDVKVSWTSISCSLRVFVILSNSWRTEEGFRLTGDVLAETGVVRESILGLVINRPFLELSKASVPTGAVFWTLQAYFSWI